MPKVFAELVRDKDKQVILYLRRTDVSAERDGELDAFVQPRDKGLAFFFLARQDSPLARLDADTIFSRVSSNRRALELFTVRSKGFQHSGLGFAGVCNVANNGVASVRLDRVLPNVSYVVAISFSADRDDAYPPFTDVLALRESTERKAKLATVVRAEAHSPWAEPMLRKWASIHQLALVFGTFVRKSLHVRSAPLHARVFIRNVNDPLCEQFIAATNDGKKHIAKRILVVELQPPTQRQACCSKSCVRLAQRAPKLSTRGHGP